MRRKTGPGGGGGGGGDGGGGGTLPKISMAATAPTKSSNAAFAHTGYDSSSFRMLSIMVTATVL